MTSPAAGPHDPLLPQLPVALDNRAMAGVLAALFAAESAAQAAAGGGRSGLRVQGCEIERVKYRPRRNLAVAYRLLMRGADGSTHEQRVAARFCAGGESARRAAKARATLQALGVAGPGCSHHAGLDMVAHWWPHDPKLGLAARLLGDERALAVQALPELVASLTAGRGRLRAQQLTLVQVVPELRASARVVLHVEAAGQAPASRTVYVKTDAEQRGAVSHAVMSALWRSPAAVRGQLVTPEPLLWQAGLGLHWQAALPGQPLLDVEPVLRTETSARVGMLLAALHATPVPASRRCSFDALRERIGFVLDTVALVRGDDARPHVARAAQLTAGLSHLHGQPNQTLHGDLHPRNLLVQEGRLSLIDLDSVRQGPALLELGDWVADALYRALLAGRSPATALPACRAFVAAYAQASGWHPAEPALAWAVAHSLVTQRAWRCVVNLKPGRFALVSSLLMLADALLEHGSLDAAIPALQEAA